MKHPVIFKFLLSTAISSREEDLPVEDRGRYEIRDNVLIIRRYVSVEEV